MSGTPARRIRHGHRAGVAGGAGGPSHRTRKGRQGWTWAPVLALSCGIAGCSAAPSPAPTPAPPMLTVAHALGSRQCEDGGVDPSALVEALRAAATTPVALLGCGHDGRLRPQVCGAADGRTVVVRIDRSAADAAARLGWTPVGATSGVRPCAPAGSAPGAVR